MHFWNRFLNKIQPAWCRWLLGVLLSGSAIVLSEPRRELVLVLLPLVIAVTIGTIVVHVSSNKLILFDYDAYDAFVGGIFTPSLIFEMMMPIAPSTTAMLVSLCFHGGGLIATLLSF